MSEKIQTTFDEGQSLEVPITPDPAMERLKKRKQRMMERFAEAKMAEKFGSKVMQVKMRTLAALGMEIEKHGIRRIGHAKIAAYGETAQDRIDELVDIVHELRSKVPPCDPQLIIDAMQVIRAFNEQVFESGKAHITADKQANPIQDEQHIKVPYKAGTPMMIGVPPQKQGAIEGGKPET